MLFQWGARAATEQRRKALERLFQERPFAPEWPYSAADFDRLDNSVDDAFYAYPRLVTHIDDAAIAALTDYYRRTLRDDTDVLDLCSSWVSHLPDTYRGRRVVGLGMNAEELQRNPQLTEWVVCDLNRQPRLPFSDASFDYVTCVVSVDYLTRPLEVFREIGRVLRPGGMCIVSQSNRCFMQKAIALWLSTNDVEHAYIIGSYFHYAGGFENIQARDITRGAGDPMFVVCATRQA